MLNTCNIDIINGSQVGDIMGNYTCHHYNGSSVVDYMITSKHVKNNIQHFKVLDFTSLSDHSPLSCAISTRKISRTVVQLPNMEDKSPGFRWTNDSGSVNSAQHFFAAQNNEKIKASISEIKELQSKCISTDDVYNLNNRLVSIIINIADSSLEKKRVGKKRFQNKNVWFDQECRTSKRKLTKMARNFGKKPASTEARQLYHAKKRDYRKLLKHKKNKFLFDLNASIENGNDLNWKKMKSLKNTKSKSDGLSIHDMDNFYNFSKELYSKNSLPDDKSSCLLDMIDDNLNNQHYPEFDILNNDIIPEELEAAIKKLKAGKAVAEDNIMNEFLIYSNKDLKSVILSVFNACLEKGVYPWNNTVITSLHKKGDRSDPNNYRAIAVGSNLGKLFSSILLERLIQYKNVHQPDPVNQLGFCKNSQTSDHIFTLHTCISKYVHHYKKRLYTCFVDFQKAFDMVSREALLYKISEIGIKGRFFDCIKFMYNNSKAKIKLINKLSSAIDIYIGTEQGHPMSPELFKCYLRDLSSALDQAPGTNLPKLNNTFLTHLLWADDLGLTALDRKSLQILLNVLHKYCTSWGLTVNIDKTAILIFNKTGRLLKESYLLNYGDMRIPPTKNYCYLGIVLTSAAASIMHKRN